MGFHTASKIVYKLQEVKTWSEQWSNLLESGKNYAQKESKLERAPEMHF